MMLRLATTSSVATKLWFHDVHATKSIPGRTVGEGKLSSAAETMCIYANESKYLIVKVDFCIATIILDTDTNRQLAWG